MDTAVSDLAAVKACDVHEQKMCPKNVLFDKEFIYPFKLKLPCGLDAYMFWV